MNAPTHARRLLVTLGLWLAAALLPLAAVLPIAPGLIGMIELDWATNDYSYMAWSPVLALTYVVGTCVFIVAVKWLLLGRVRAGRAAAVELVLYPLLVHPAAERTGAGSDTSDLRHAYM